ncbi:hypothetical protein FDUTEX481_05763 [Tolypothrix sp. PCC 7601]|nr:hypothetical protein FDUTEX481_05763 [Tolypothrix sp. PCC 7601]
MGNATLLCPYQGMYKFIKKIINTIRKLSYLNERFSIFFMVRRIIIELIFDF